MTWPVLGIGLAALVGVFALTYGLDALEKTESTSAREPGDVCGVVLSDPRLQGQGRLALVQLETDTGQSCKIEFHGGDSALRQLGYSSVCPPEAPILVAFDVDRASRAVTVDRTATSSIDNAGCIVEAK